MSKNEDSIYQAMLSSIEAAQYYIYIENQFFITTAAEQQNSEDLEIINKIGSALVQKIKEAHK